MTDHSADSRSVRQQYEAEVRGLAAVAEQLRNKRVSTEMIARHLHQARRDLARHYKALTPEPLRTQIYQRTVSTYGDENGPGIDFLRGQGKTWQQIIDSACRPAQNSGGPASDH